MAGRRTDLGGRADREIATYAIDHTDLGYLVRGSLHGLIVTVARVLLVAVASAIRLCRRRHLRLAPSH